MNMMSKKTIFLLSLYCESLKLFNESFASAESADPDAIVEML